MVSVGHYRGDFLLELDAGAMGSYAKHVADLNCWDLYATIIAPS